LGLAKPVFGYVHPTGWMERLLQPVGPGVALPEWSGHPFRESQGQRSVPVLLTEDYRFRVTAKHRARRAE